MLTPPPTPLRERIRTALRGRSAKGAAWILVEYGLMNVIRFGSNVALSRLLFPEAFGLMTLVNTVLLGLEMFSDVGTSAAMIVSHRGNDDDYVRTAYTVNVVRGALLCVLAIALAVPMSALFDEPAMASLLLVSAVNPLIRGFASTKTTLSVRDSRLGAVTTLRLTSQLLSIGAMIGLAWLEPSPWALVWGTTFGTLVEAAGSHALPGPRRDGFGWSPTLAREMIRFGRWIMVTTVLAFLAGKGETLVVGALLDASDLGVFGIALALANLPGEALRALGSSLLLARYARAFREAPGDADKLVRRARTVVIAGGVLLHLPLIVGGSAFVHFVYDDRYANAAWMLPLLATGFACGLASKSYDWLLHAKSQTFDAMVLQSSQLILQFACLGVGYYLGGLPGLVFGAAFHGALSYPLVALALRRHQLWHPGPDSMALLASAVSLTLFWALHSSFSALE